MNATTRSLHPTVPPLLARLWRALRAWRAAPAADLSGQDELVSMSERELRDLGIGRSQIPGLAVDARERHREYR